MAPDWNQNPLANQFDINAPGNIWAAPLTSLLSQTLYTGGPIAQGMGGKGPLDLSPITGLLGMTDPGTKTILNSVMGGVLTSALGGGYLPSQYSPTTNMYSQMKAMNATKGYRNAMSGAAPADSDMFFEMQRGVAQMTGSEFGPREQEAARKFSGVAASILPNLPIPATQLESMGLGGKTGLATAMAQNMFMGARYATDPITGKRGIDPGHIGDMTGKVFENLYGPGKDVAEMGGITAGKAGEMYDVMQRKGLMGSASTRSKALEQVSKDMNITIGEASSLPELDTKIRELDANRISEKLKEMSKAVSAMKEIFGEMGQPDAPMGQLVGAIEALTQANLPSMDSAKTERMIRDTSNTAKAAGIDMPQMFKLMGSTAAMSDRAGVDRVFTPGITNQAVLENEASKRMFGDSKAFGLSTAEKRLNMSQQLGVQATKDPRVQQMAAIARLVDQYKFEPEKNSELARIHEVITGKREATEEESRRIVNITSRPGGMAAFLKKEGVSASVIQDLSSNEHANAEYMHKYDIGGKLGKPMQTERVTRELSMYGENVIARYAKDDTSGGSSDLKKAMLGDSKDLSQVVARALMNPSSEEVGDPQGIAKRAIQAHLKSKGVATNGADDDKLIDSMAAGLSDSAKGYAVRGNMGSYANMATTMSPKILREAAISKAEVSQESRFQEILRGVGKTDVGQRVSDLIRGAGPGTSMKEGIAAILGFTKTDEIEGLLGPEIEAMEKASKQLNGFDANKVRESYIRNAAVKNKIETDEAVAQGADIEDPEGFKLLGQEKEKIKAQLKSAGLGGSTPEDLEKAYTSFSDFTKLDEFKGKDKAGALAAANAKLANLKEDTGVTAEELDQFDNRSVTIIGQGRALDNLQKTMNGAGMEAIQRQGRFVPGKTPFAGLNSAYNNLNDTNIKNAKYGMDAFEKFSDTYLKSAEASSMGEKGLAAMNKGKGAGNTLRDLASDLKVSIDDLLGGKVPEGADTSYLNQIRKEDSGLIGNLQASEANKTQNDAYREGAKEKIKSLKEGAEKKPELRDKNNLRIKELEKILNAKPDELEDIKASADKTVADLSGVDNELITKKKEDSALAAKLQDPKQAEAVRASTKKEVENLKASTPTDAKLKEKNDLRIKEKEKILNASPEELKEIKASADKTVSDLSSGSAEAITKEFKAFEVAQAGKVKVDTELDNLIKNINKAKPGAGLTKNTIDQFTKEGISAADLKEAVGLGNDKAKLSAPDQQRKEALLKKAGAGSVEEMRKIDQVKSLTPEKKTELETLLNIKEKSSDQKVKLASLLKESGAADENEYKKLAAKKGLDKTDSQELMGYNRAGLTAEEKAKKDKLLTPGGLSSADEIKKADLLKAAGARDIDEAKKIAKSTKDPKDKANLTGIINKIESLGADREKYPDLNSLERTAQLKQRQMEQLTPQERKELKDKQAAAEGATKDVDSALGGLKGFGGAALASVLKATGLKKYTDALLTQNKEATNELGQSISKPSGSRLTPKQLDEAKLNVSLQQNKDVADKFLKDLNVEDAAKEGTGAGRGKVASQINQAARIAFDADKTAAGKKDTLEERTKSLRNLMHAEEGTLSPEDKSRRDILTKTHGISKGMFKAGKGNEGVEFSTDDLKKSFLAEDKKMKADQDKAAGKGPIEVVFKDGVKVSGIINIKGEADLLMSPDSAPPHAA